jgi:hypothetical protein
LGDEHLNHSNESDRMLYFGEYDASGADLSLIRYVLQLTPLERLKLMEQSARGTQVLNEYGRRHREASASQDR